jgi:LuxR family transcriptional activator of bioluminescence operon
VEAWVKDAIRRLQACADLVELKAILVGFRERLGFTHVLYGVQLPAGFTTISHLIVSDYPDEWLKEYLGAKYYEIDPVVRHCTSRHDAYCWDRLHDERDAAVVAFTARAAAHGLVGGVSIGIHGHAGDIGIFSLARGSIVETDSDEAVGVMLHQTAILPYVHEAVTRLVSFKEAEARRPSLSERERECLLWSAEGKTGEEIALILSISSATVAFHLKNAISKLEVANRNQAIAKAALLGVITPQYSTSSAPRTYLF